MSNISARLRDASHGIRLSREAADHIDAQAATIKSLVEVLSDYWNGDHFKGVSSYDGDRIAAAIAAAKDADNE